MRSCVISALGALPENPNVQEPGKRQALVGSDGPGSTRRGDSIGGTARQPRRSLGAV